MSEINGLNVPKNHYICVPMVQFYHTIVTRHSSTGGGNKPLRLNILITNSCALYIRMGRNNRMSL